MLVAVTQAVNNFFALHERIIYLYFRIFHLGGKMSHKYYFSAKKFVFTVFSGPLNLIDF